MGKNEALKSIITEHQAKRKQRSRSNNRSYIASRTSSQVHFLGAGAHHLWYGSKQTTGHSLILNQHSQMEFTSIACGILTASPN